MIVLTGITNTMAKLIAKPVMQKTKMDVPHLLNGLKNQIIGVTLLATILQP